MGDLSPIFEIGPMVWRYGGKINWSDPFDDWNPEWIEPWGVDRVTAQTVFIRSYLDPENPSDRAFTLSRSLLQRKGFAVSRTVNNGPGQSLGAAFLVRRPEAYRRKTLGYLIQSEPRAVLGVSGDATESDVRRAYLRLAMQHHPDRGGDPAQFALVQEAYESLGKAPSLAEMLDFISRQGDVDADR